VEGDLDGIRLNSQNVTNLPCREVGAISKRNEFLVSLFESRDRGHEAQAPRGVFLQIAGCGHLSRFVDELAPVTERVVDASSRDPEQPCDGVAERGVIGLAVTQRALERVARDVLGVGTVAEPVRDVRVDAPDQRFGIPERVGVEQSQPVGGI
jgi:hypothetical protein